MLRWASGKYLLIDIGELERSRGSRRSPGSLPPACGYTALMPNSVYQLVEDELPLRVCGTPIRLQPAEGFRNAVHAVAGQHKRTMAGLLDRYQTKKDKSQGKSKSWGRPWTRACPTLDVADRECIVALWLTTRHTGQHASPESWRLAGAPEEWEAILDVTEPNLPS